MLTVKCTVTCSCVVHGFRMKHLSQSKDLLVLIGALTFATVTAIYGKSGSVWMTVWNQHL